MGEVLGYVTRGVGAPSSGLSGMTAGLVNGVSGNSFIGSKANGPTVGAYRTAREAQRAVEGSTVGSRLLKWYREPTAFEQWRGESPEFWPGDLGLLLQNAGWWRADRGTILRPASPPAQEPRLARRWHAINSELTRLQAIAPSDMLAPIYVDGNSTETARPGLRFTGGQRLAVSTFSLTRPFTLYVACTFDNEAPDHRQDVLTSSGGGGMRLGVSATTDLWTVHVDGTDLNGPAAVDGDTGIFCVRQSATACSFSLNGVEVASAVKATPAQSSFIISGAAPNGWGGDIYEVLLLPSLIPPRISDYINAYMMRRYLVS